VSPVLGLALRAGLGAVLALVLVAGPAHREAADVAGSEDVALRRGAQAVAADLAHLPDPMPPRLLHTKRRIRGEVRPVPVPIPAQPISPALKIASKISRDSLWHPRRRPWRFTHAGNRAPPAQDPEQ
jgi:hypothetical protein